MQAGVDHQPHGAQHFVIKPTVHLVRIGEHAELRPQAFGIERPAFNIGGIAAIALERRQLVILLCEADLEMMPRRAFVKEQGLHAPC